VAIKKFRIQNQSSYQSLVPQQQLQGTDDAPDSPDADESTTPPTGETPPEAEETKDEAPETQEEPPARASKVVTMPAHRMVELKRQEREKGKRAALAALDAEAKGLGYASHAAMVAALKAKRSRVKPSASRTSAPEPETENEETDTSTPTAPRGRTTREQRELLRAQEQRRAANRARAAAERKARQLEKQREADRAEHELRIVAVSVGVKDIDYALTILKRQLAGMSQAELAKFDERKFFSDTLRKSHPYLYGEAVQPVTTSPSSESKEAPPTPPNKPTPPTAPPKDVRQMSRQEYDAYLRSKGLTPPHLGSPG
jgi:hypothetical protein